MGTKIKSMIFLYMLGGKARSKGLSKTLVYYEYTKGVSNTLEQPGH